jgi:hypothetical protein
VSILRRQYAACALDRGGGQGVERADQLRYFPIVNRIDLDAATRGGGDKFRIVDNRLEGVA